MDLEDIKMMLGESADAASSEQRKLAAAMRDAILEKWPDLAEERESIDIQLRAHMYDTSTFFDLFCSGDAVKIVGDWSANRDDAKSLAERFESGDGDVLKVDAKSDGESTPSLWWVSR